MTAQLKNCKTEFSACKQVSRKSFLRSCLICKYQNHVSRIKPSLLSLPQAEDDGMKAMSSWATLKAELFDSAKTLTENSAGIDAAETKARIFGGPALS